MKKAMTALLASLLLLGMCGTAMAKEADPEPGSGIFVVQEDTAVLRDVQNISNGDVLQIAKIYDAPPDFETKDIAQSFEQNGAIYTVGDILMVRENYNMDTKLASQTVTITHEEEGDASLLLAPLIDYDSEGYTGQLQLERASIVTKATDKKSYSYTISDTKEITGLTRNDTYYVPKTSLKNGVTLKLAGVDWVAMGDGTFKANASYTGTGYGSKVTNYTSTATYVGEAEKKTLESIRWKVIFNGRQIPQKDNTVFIWLSVIIVGLVAAVVGIVVFLRLRKRPAFIVEEDRK